MLTRLFTRRWTDADLIVWCVAWAAAVLGAALWQVIFILVGGLIWSAIFEFLLRPKPEDPEND